MESCLSRHHKVFGDGREAPSRGYGTSLVQDKSEFDPTLFQDAAIPNVIRACETSVDLANMRIRERRPGIPTESRNSFLILVRENSIEIDLGAAR